LTFLRGGDPVGLRRSLSNVNPPSIGIAVARTCRRFRSWRLVVRSITAVDISSVLDPDTVYACSVVIDAIDDPETPPAGRKVASELPSEGRSDW
jgi:hypothetical protein